MELTGSKYSNSDKNSIKTMISRCSPSNCNKIYDMLILENIKMTKNNNGYFLNLSNVGDETIDKIKEMLNNLENNDVILSNNIESDYENYNIEEVNKKSNIETKKMDINYDIEENTEIIDDDNEIEIQSNNNEIDNEIDNDNDNDNEMDEMENSYYYDNDNDENDDISNKFYQKKQELSPYLSKLIKKCKDIQKNNEMDNIDNIDDFEDGDYIFDSNQELTLDMSYSI